MNTYKKPLIIIKNLKNEDILTTSGEENKWGIGELPLNDVQGVDSIK